MDPFALVQIAERFLQEKNLEQGEKHVAMAEEVLHKASRHQQCRCLILIGLLHWDHLCGIVQAVGYFSLSAELDRSSPVIVLGASLNALGAYCMGMRSDFQTCADIVKNHQGSSEVGRSCGTLMSLLAHVELGVEMMEFDEPFALELPHPFRLLLTALLSSISLTTNDFDGFEDRDTDVRRTIAAFLALSPAPVRLPAHLLPAATVWVGTQVRVCGALVSRFSPYRPTRGAFNDLLQLIPLLRRAQCEDPGAVNLARKLDALEAVLMKLGAAAPLEMESPAPRTD